MMGTYLQENNIFRVWEHFARVKVQVSMFCYHYRAKLCFRTISYP